MDERQENFPIGTYRYLDGLLSDVRVAVSRRAAELAGDENPDSPAYTVGYKHVTAAWKEHRHAQTLLDIAERDRTYRKLDFACEQGKELVEQNDRLTAELAEATERRAETAAMVTHLTSELVEARDCGHAEDANGCGDCNACLELHWRRELGLRRKRDAELSEARRLLEPCRPDTDSQTPEGAAAYPATVNDVLSLLSSHWADVMQACPTDEYFGAWERLARPVIERLFTKSVEAEVSKLLECRRHGCCDRLPADNYAGVVKLRAECADWQKRAEEAERSLAEAKRERDELRSFIAQAVPFLEEAWKACFHGEEKALLSCEERGMGQLLATFRKIADGKPALPPGVVTQEEASKYAENAIAWAHRLLGRPNELKPELREWILPGETCAHGIERANAEVVSLRAELASERQAFGRLADKFRELDADLWEAYEPAGSENETLKELTERKAKWLRVRDEVIAACREPNPEQESKPQQPDWQPDWQAAFERMADAIRKMKITLLTSVGPGTYPMYCATTQKALDALIASCRAPQPEQPAAEPPTKPQSYSDAACQRSARYALAEMDLSDAEELPPCPPIPQGPEPPPQPNGDLWEGPGHGWELPEQLTEEETAAFIANLQRLPCCKGRERPEPTYAAVVVA
ncbi:MAG: hypothetical protein PHU85_02035, partial [Phycisphaerae bacterium]|nr:hypothetical protein [Phycisphaerae bacterium]